jgi:hypothetical protein
LTNRLTDFDAIEAGKHHVEEDDIRLVVPEDFQSLIATTDEIDFDSSTVEDDPQHLSKVLIILDDQYRGH